MAAPLPQYTDSSDVETGHTREAYARSPRGPPTARRIEGEQDAHWYHGPAA
jgi:hypothetical protein